MHISALWSITKWVYRSHFRESGSITIVSYACMGRTLCSVRPPFDIDEGNVSMQQGLRMMKERKRVAWILLLLAVLFAMCWLPYNIMQLLLDINSVDAKHLSEFLPYALFLERKSEGESTMECINCGDTKDRTDCDGFRENFIKIAAACKRTSGGNMSKEPLESFNQRPKREPDMVKTFSDACVFTCMRAR
ncbi:hypothetical protein EVAR_97991_1 [Eumeta japonica]|uniref:G-protein coupled receptors family 1 profile domain-containing protein n=1 Tax=Eumeta variegata TaxID=151549 RepID=A0A4C1WLZ6_EUMVA|nr:hypothetical protein EVAR_97991_1 [Eumeta japonica]